LIISTHEDYTFVFYEFKFDINTQHMAFKKAMQKVAVERYVKG